MSESKQPRFIANPIDIILETACELYPNKLNDVNITVVSDLKTTDDCQACTVFSNTSPLVLLDAEIPFKYIPDMLAHELAHVVLGVKHKDVHDGEWQAVFDKILNTAQQRAFALQDTFATQYNEQIK